MNLEEAKLFLKVEDNTDDNQIQKDLESAKSLVNRFIVPKLYETDEKDKKLSEDEQPIADKAVQYALHHFYQNRDGLNNQDFITNLKYILQPIRTLRV